MLLPLRRPGNAEMLMLCDAIILEWCYVVLCNALIFLNVLYESQW